MSLKIFSVNPFRTFYFVFAYILVFSMWWAYLLYDKNETAFSEKIELNEIRYKMYVDKNDYASTEDYRLIHSKYQRQKLMIITEGAVFILLLLFGLMRVRKVFSDEMKLAYQQKNFLLSVTHELKSPLSTIKLSLQTLAKHKLEPEKTQKLVNNSLVDLDRLETLVENILFAAKIERDKPGFSSDEINLSEIVQMTVERFADTKKSIAINADVKPDVYLKADPIGFTSVITNLIENAIKYSEPGAAINVLLSSDNEKVVFEVADTGLGIPSEEKEKIFEKFYRIGNEDTRKTKGTGLGLFIVKRFVEIYKGSIVVEDNHPKGSVFRLMLPIID